MFLTETITLEQLKLIAAAFFGVLIPLLIAYKVGKKTNFLVALLTIAVYSTLIVELTDTLVGVNENLAASLVAGIAIYLSPVVGIFEGMLGFVGVAGTVEPLVLYGALFAVTLTLAIIGNFFSPIKFINSLINTLLFLAVLALSAMYFFG